jgi:putative endonuclease
MQSAAQHNSPMAPIPTQWTVYILLCGDDTLYTGVTTDMARRLREHNSPARGAKYTRCRQPVRLVYTEQVNCRQEACRREVQIKRLRRTGKLALVSTTEKTSLDP